MLKQTSLKQTFFALALALGLVTGDAHGETYPSRPITWIVPYPAGGVTDLAARLMAKFLSAKLGQPVIVDNKAGASGIVGTEYVAAAKPDGYTLLYGSSGPLALNPTTVKNLSYNSPDSFTPIQATWESPLVLVINANKPFKTFDEFLAYAKANPEKINFGSAGIGSNGHLAGEEFQAATGVKLTHIPYKGTAPEAADLIAGVIDAAFDYSSVVKPYIDSGRIRALATTGSSRMASFSEVPTMAELGYPRATTSAWSGMLAPANTPQPIIDLLARTMGEVLATPDVVAYYEGNGSIGLPDKTKSKFRDFIVEETAKYKAVIVRSGMVTE